MSAGVNPRLLRRMIRCRVECRHCRGLIISEDVAVYGKDMPDVVYPNWFFTALATLDHLRDCESEDHSIILQSRYGPDFANHPNIGEWVMTQVTFDRTFLYEAPMGAKTRVDEE